MNNGTWTVRAKLASGFGGLCLFALVVAGLSLYSTNQANERFTNYVNGMGARAHMAESVRTAVNRRAVAAYNLLLVTTAEDLAHEEAAVNQSHQDVQSRLGALKEMTAKDEDPRGRSLVGDIDTIERRYGPLALDTARMTLHGKGDEAIAQMNKDGRPLLASLVNATDAYLDYIDEKAKVQIGQSREDFASQRNVLIAGCLLAILCAISAGFLITRSLTRELGAEPLELGRIAQRVASGDLSAVAPGGEGSVLASLADMQRSLAGMVGQVRQTADAIATGSGQISSGNADLSQRTEEQASALEQTAATMEQLGGTVRANAESAKRANELAQGASSVASKGGAVVKNVVDTMRGINDSSRRIAEIIGVIDGIAFQTNILALNAAVEAARAGEQGRGFAVVAAEVRSLAQRSASAAREISSLITNSVEQVGQGTELVDQAGKTMEEIVGAINRVTSIVGEINFATTEQSNGLAQVGGAVSQMDRVTQQNAALVEQSAAATESLAQLAQELIASVAVFKIDRTLARAPANALAG
jgi:methyl-accepting chemotaxis protein-1 (serine sensor receptor)